MPSPERRRNKLAVKAFDAPNSVLGNVDAEAAATLISAAADIALVLDESGTIHDVTVAEQDLLSDLAGPIAWIGSAWSATVTPESRPKIEALIAEAKQTGAARWRHVNHPAASGPDVPVMYAAVRVGTAGRLVALGRDLRAMSQLQRRLVDAQQSMERDYARIRHVESRYRLLFQLASDVVILLDGAGRRVIDSNPAARRLFGAAVEANQTWPPAATFTEDGARAVELLLAGVRASARADDVQAQLRDGETVQVAVSLFRDEGGTSCLVRILRPAAAGGTAEGLPKLKVKPLKLMENAPDGFVVTGMDGRIITANAAFLDQVRVPTETQITGQPLSRWLGRSGIDLDVLTVNLRQTGSVRLFASRVRGELGEETEVEVSAVTVMNGGQPCYGFAIRDVSRRLRPAQRIDAGLRGSLEHVTELIGRVTLKDLVREATDVIERLCIETALGLTGDNRASAAEMLGLSRQSLYVKLRRYGLVDEGAD